MHILITGGTGLIGRPLTARLLQAGHQVSVVTRDVAAARHLLGEQVNLWSGLDQQRDLNGIDAVINLAGEPIADKRWNEAQKRQLCDSRWLLTERLVALIQASSEPPALLISGSATGFYGDAGEVVLTDESTGQSTRYKAGDSWFVTKGTPVLWEVVSESFVKHYFAVV